MPITAAPQPVRLTPADTGGAHIHWPDTRLTQAAAAGDRGAFAELCARHEPRVRRLCRSITGCPEDAADATQEALLAVLRRLPSLVGREVDFGAYFAVSARNAAYEVCRRRARRRASELTGEVAQDRAVDPAPGPEARLLQREAGRGVRAAVAALPPRHRQALVLRHVLDLGHEELAAHVGGNANSAAQLLFRARAGLRGELERAAA